MRISNLTLEGFGVFHDASLEGIPDGVVLISGDNEAGKSTLLGFIRAILFGFPDGRTNENLYEPLAGGQHGGRIAASTQRHGEVIIERTAGKRGGPVSLLFSRDGSRGGEAELGQLLGGFSRTIYRNIYAFSLTELQTFDSLNADDVRSALYGAGAGTSLMAIPESMRRLDKNLDSLFKPGGSKPAINAKLGDLENVQRELRDAVGDIRDYEKQMLDRQAVQARIEELQQKESKIENNHHRIESHLKLWDQWVILQDAEARLAKLPYVVSGFPNDGLIRLDNLRANLGTMAESLDKAERSKADLESQLENLVVDTLLLAHESDVLQLKEDLTRYVDGRQTLLDESNALKQRKSEIQRELAGLGSDWTEQRVRAIDRSLFTQDAIRRYQSRHQEGRSEQGKAEDALKQAQEEYEAACRQEEAAEEAMAGFQDLKPLPDASILADLQNGRDQFASITEDLPKREKEREDASRDLDQAIQEIDPDWTVASVESFDCSVQAQEKIQEFERALDATQSKIETASNRLEFEQSGLANIQRGLGSLEEALSTIPEPSLPTREAFVSRRNDLRALKNRLSRKALLSESVSGQEEQLADMQNAMRVSRSPGIGDPTGPLKWVSLALVLIGLLTTGTLWVLLDHRLLGGVLGAVLILLGLCLLLLRRIAANRLSVTGHSDQALEEERKAIRKLEERIENLRREVAGIESESGKLTSALGIPADIGLGDIDALENELEVGLEQFAEKTRLKADLTRAKETQRATSERVEDLAAQIETQAKKRRQAQDGWERLLESLSLKPGTQPRTVNLIFTKVDGIRTRIDNLKSLQERIAEMVSARDQYNALLLGIPELAGKVSEDPSRLLAAVDGFLAETRASEKRRQGRDLAAQTLEDRRKRREIAKQKAGQVENRMEQALKRQEREAEAWQAWLTDNGFDPGVTPETASDALATVNRCIQLMDAKSDLEESISQKEHFAASYIAASTQLFTKLGRTEPAHPRDNGLGAEIELIAQALEQSKIDREKSNSLRDRLESTCREIDAVKQRIAVQEKQIAELMQEGGAADEETFRARGELFQKRQALLADVASAGKNMKVISGESDLEVLKGALAEQTKEELESEKKSLEQELRETGDDLEAARQQLAEIKNRLEVLASSDDISRLRAEEEKHKEEIRSSARTWGAHAIARHLLTLARERFEKEHQPKVIREASSFFRMFTGGEYQSIIAPLGKQSIEVVTARGRQKSPQQLSRATVEQLFLALRFGYMVNYAENNEVLPVIMDDILVNFDPIRAGHTSEAILELAKTHQILFFTCHPETISVFRKQQADLPVYRIENGQFRAGG